MRAFLFSKDNPSPGAVHVAGAGGGLNTETKRRKARLYSEVAARNLAKADALAMDVPLFIRLLEFAREDANSDLDLHFLAENAVKAGGGTLSMDDYNKIVPDVSKRYDTVDSLPDPVKQKFKGDATRQRQWMHVFNSALDRHGDESRAFAEAWASTKRSAAEKRDTLDVSVIRHGATELNNDDVSVDRIRGWKDIPLSDQGRQEAEKLGNKLKANPPGCLVASDLKRAHDTARIISDECGSPVHWVTTAMRPWNVGDYAGQKSSEAIPVLADYATKKPDEPLPGGESFNDFRSRFFGGLSQLADETYSKPVGIVTHHRNERLLHAWAAAGFPEDGSIDPSVFNQRGEHTGAISEMKLPVDKLRAASMHEIVKYAMPGIPHPHAGFATGQQRVLRGRRGDFKPEPKPQVAQGRVARPRPPSADAGPAIRAKIFEGKPMAGGGGGHSGMKKFIKAERVLPDLGLVIGWAIVCKENGQDYWDVQKNHIPEDAMLEASADFMEHSRNGNEMHSGSDKGTYLFAFPLTTEIAKAMDIQTRRTGLMIGYKPPKDVLAKFASGEYTGFSIEGYHIELENAP